MEDATGVVSPPAGEVVGSGASEGASASAITVNIKTLNGADFELSVDTQELVSELKTKIRRQTDVDETRQRLIYRGKVLADAEPLSTYKVESGHFVHMVARPEGLPPPASAQDAPRSATSNAGNAAPAAAAGGSAADGAQRTDAFGAGLTRVISDRLLMGMGALSAPNAPAAPGRAAGRRQGRHGHNHGMDNALLNAAAGLEQGDFLSNMLALGGDGGGGRAEAAGGTRASRGIPRNPLPDGLVGGRRGARGVRSAAAAATAASPLLGRGADAEQQGALGGGANLEHVRQGLLTLHTLLSGTTASRTRQRPQESPEENADVSPPQPSTTEATVDGPAAVPDGTNSGAGEGESDSATPVAAVAAVAAASEDEATLTTETLTPAPIAGEEPVPVGAAAGSATNAAAAEAAAGASLKADRRCPDERDVQAAAEAEEEEAAMPSHGPRLSGGSGGGSIGGGGDGSSVPRAWLAPASFDDGTDEEDADGGGEEGGSGEAGEEDRDAGAHAGSLLDGHRLRLSSESGSPLASSRGSRAVSGVSEEEAAESGAEAEAEATAPAEAGSDLSDGPPRLQSESGESGDGEDDEDGGGWEGHRVSGPGWSRGFLRGPLGTSLQEEEGEEEEEVEVVEEECKDEGGFSGRRQPQEQRRRRFFVGQWLDVKDTVNNWLEATVIDMTHSGTRLQIHYNGWPPRWDEWISWDSPRIAPFRTRTQHLPQAQHVSPAPVSAVRNAPRTGPLVDDVRVLLPEVQRVLREISPMVDELSACYAGQLEEDPSTAPVGGRAVSHTLPWTRQRLQQHHQDQDRHRDQPPDQHDHRAAGASPAQQPAAAGDWSGRFKATTELAADIAPLFDRLGRVLTDVAPHLARLSAAGDEADAEGEDAAEPGELPWETLGRPPRRQEGGGGGGGGGSVRPVPRGDARRGTGGGSREGFPSAQEETASSFRQLVSTSNPAPAPASSNINIHIHAIVPMRGPPSPPSPPPPPPPTASASAVATPTRAERPPLPVNSSSSSSVAGGGGGRGTGVSPNSDSRPWNDSYGPTASLMAAAAAARAGSISRAIASSQESGSATERVGGRGGSASTPSRNTSLGSSFPSDLTRQASPLTVATPEALPRTVRTRSRSRSIAEAVGPLPSSPSSASPGGNPTAGSRSADTAGASGPAAPSSSAVASAPGSGGAQAHGHRRTGGWRGLLRAFGVGGNGGSSRVSGRRDGGGGGSGGGSGAGTEGSGD